MTDSNDLVQPPLAASENAHLKNMEEYQTMYQNSIDDPEGFWAEVADEFHWYSKWETVRGYNYDRREGPISVEWFKGCLLYTSPSPRDLSTSRMPSSA